MALGKPEDAHPLAELLRYEHQTLALKLGLTDSPAEPLALSTVLAAVGAIDRLSRTSTPGAGSAEILLAALLWEHASVEWPGIRDFLTVALSRSGAGPATLVLHPDRSSDGLYAHLDSYQDQLATTIYQMMSTISVGGEQYLLTAFQKGVWDMIQSTKVLGVSAPTSAGKSFVLALAALELILQEPGTIVYIVPTLTLVNQVATDFRRLLRRHGVLGYSVLTTFLPDTPNQKNIFVLTQEKAIGALSREGDPFPHLRLLVADEIQNVERVANEEDLRSKILYELLIELRFRTSPDHVVISGPRVEGLSALGKSLFEVDTPTEQTSTGPVASLTYSLRKRGKNVSFVQHPGLPHEPAEIPVAPGFQIPGIGGSQYRPDFHLFLANFVQALGPTAINIVFAPNASQARKTAIALANNLPEVETDARLTSLIKYIGETVHVSYHLCDSLRSEVGYHHGKLPHHVRFVIERAIQDKLVRHVVATTTLMQGVNLPAQNVIIRNPNLYINRTNGEPRLTDYEIANLRGRAGRLLRDFLGRTFIFDETWFDSDREETLFPEATKELRPSYSGTYETHRDEIEAKLRDGDTPAADTNGYAHILTYVRQTILRYGGEEGAGRLSAVGIVLPPDLLHQVAADLQGLAVPRTLCIENRYWDPIDLDRLFERRFQFSLPTATSDPRIAAKLRSIVEFFQQNFRLYWQRYFPIQSTPTRDLLLSACINAQHWVREKPLKTILSTDFYDDPDRIDETISLLLSKIGYGLPMLLKPLYDMMVPDSTFLRFLEAGAFRPATRRLIEHNIPRETAIQVVDLFEEQSDFLSDPVSFLRAKGANLPYWTRIQLEILG